jgi:hypothetical protein
MNTRNDRADLERAIAAMKNDEPSEAQLHAAGDRVLQRLRVEAPTAEVVESIRGCADVRALLPDYRAQRLSQARWLLVEDHLHECVACRRFSETHARAEQVAWQTAMPSSASWWTLPRFAAAMAVLLIAVTSFLGYQRFNAAPAGPRATVQSVQGELFLVSAKGTRPVTAGAQISETESLRTANASHAFVQLSDGSVVEMNERAEFSVGATRRDTTIRLDRGNIIVQAAHRRLGHLYVAARDCRVAVTGTVFSVNSGTKGSRIAVVEGEVRVARAGAESVLHSGDVLATSANMEAVPVETEIAWSLNFDQHLELLAQFAKLQRKIGEIPSPAPRYTSHILPLVAADTVVYASIPNIGEMLRQANQIFEQQMQQSQVLTDWWQHVNSGSGPGLKDLVQEITGISQYLGDEVVFVASQDIAGHRTAPAMLAQVTRSGLREYLEAEAQRLAAASTHPPHVRILGPDDLAGATADANHEMLVLLRPDTLVITPDLETLVRINAQLDAGASDFAGTPFGQKILAAYSRGAGFLFAANVQQIHAQASQTTVALSSRRLSPQRRQRLDAQRKHSAAILASGFNNLQYIVVEKRDTPAGTPDNRAVLEFSGPRTGIASWLAAPAPMGSLDFISQDASATISVVAKSPALMLDDIPAMAAASGNTDIEQHFNEFQTETGLNLRDDLAAALGTDVTFALDGPVLPTPSWKIVAEVYDPTRLQVAFQRMLEALNRKLASQGKPPARIDQEQVDSQMFYVFTPPQGPAVHYTFSDGYMIVAPSRALLLASIHTHQSGLTLARSSNFQALMPADQHANFSALLYQNLAPVLQPLTDQLSPGQMQSLQAIAADSHPTVVAAYGDADRIEFVSTSRFFGFDLNSLTLSTLVGQAKKGTSTAINP